MKKERLYDAFGELIYVVAVADGAVQQQEKVALREVLEGHPWAKEINWSFDYELRKSSNPDEVYEKAMQTFVDHGPDQEYAQLLDVMERISAAYGDVDIDEKEVILNFQYEFKARLQKDLQKRQLVDIDREDFVARSNAKTDNSISGVSKERLYDAFGELIYVIAKSDGLIQDTENEALSTILQDHPWASAIQWSFNYEQKRDHDPKKIYEKAIGTLIQNGPDPEYDALIEFLEEIAKASDGMSSAEADAIIDFEADLRKKFLEDIEKYKLKN